MGLVLARVAPGRCICLWQRHPDGPREQLPCTVLGDQADMEIRWSPAHHVIAAFNLAGLRPGGFFDHVASNRPPIVANVGLTYRF
jgi:hypothetical protein